jgi:hypothetical protein
MLRGGVRNMDNGKALAGLDFTVWGYYFSTYFDLHRAQLRLVDYMWMIL